MSGKIYEGRVARLHPDDDPLRYPWGDEKRDQAGLEEILAELQSPRPFVLLHPDDLISRGAKADVVGQVIGARIDGDHVVARILVTDQRAEAVIAAGMHELSLGYLSELNDQGFQSKIRVDHLALVPRARCGSTCALRADCEGAAVACACNNHAIRYTAVIVEPSTTANADATLNARERHALSPSMFAAPDHQGLPLEDEGHVRDAMARFNQEHFTGPSERKAAFHKIIARAHQLGIDPTGFSKKYGGQLDEKEPMDELQKKLDAALADASANKQRALALEGELAAAKASIATLEVEVTNAKADKTRADASLAAEKARADAADEKTKQAVEIAKQDAAGGFAEAVRARVALEKDADRILGAIDKDGKPVDRSALTAKQIKLAVIKHVDGLDVAPDKLDLFVDGVYLGSLSRATAAVVSIAAVRGATEGNRQDAINAPQTVATDANAEQAARYEMANRKRAGKA